MSTEIIIYSMIGLVLAVVVGFWVYMERRVEYMIHVKEMIGNKKRYLLRKGYFYTDKDKVYWIKLVGEKVKDKRLMPLPPEECVDINDKGKKVFSCYRFEDGSVVFCKDEWSPRLIPDELLSTIPPDIQLKIDDTKDSIKKKEIFDAWKKETVKKWMHSNKVVAPFEPINTKQRMLYLNNIKKAESRKSFDWKNNLISVVSIGGVVLVLICLMVFWGDLVSPALKVNDQAITMTKMQTEQLQILREIKLGQQAIGNQPPSNPPPE